MDASEHLKLLQSQREILIEARIMEEKKMEEFSKRVNSVNIEEVFGDIYIPPEMTLRSFCPEAYKEIPDPDIYQKEYDEMIRIITPINERMIQLNKEASECIAQFKQMR